MDGPEHGRPCEKCRQRRVKCDRRRPGCLRCERLSCPCPGYPTERKFLDQGASLRKRYEKPFQAAAESLASPSSRDGERHDAHMNDEVNCTPVSDTLAGHPLWRGLSSSREWSTGKVPTTNGNRKVQITPKSSTLDALQLSELETIPPDDVFFDPTFFDIDPQAYYAEGNNSCGFITDVQLVGNGGNDGNGIDDSGAESYLNTANPSDYDHELAYLIRLYTESISPWMDLHDKGGHFTHNVPLEALESSLLRYCLAAVTARQLGRTGGSGAGRHRPHTGRPYQIPSKDWFLKAAGYYDKALNFLRLLLQNSREAAEASAPVPAEQVRSDTDTRKRSFRSPESRISDAERPTKRRRIASEQSQSSTIDVLLAAVSALMVYERLESGEKDQSQHLDGLESLLQIHFPSPTTHSSRPTRCWLASFWLLARADYKEAFVNCSRTRLDTNNINLWKTAGVSLEDNGKLNMYMTESKADMVDGQNLAVIAASRTMIWILAKILNQIADQNDDSHSVTPSLNSQSCPAVRNHISHWDHIRQTLDDWHNCLPRELKPYAKARPLHRYLAEDRAASSIFDETFISDPTCATTLQLYHFARTLILQYDPLGSQEANTNVLNRLRPYRYTSEEARRHCREICSIAIGQSNPAVLPEMLQPLYLAGRCLEFREERITIVSLLRDIQTTTGFPTEYRVQDLLLDWGWLGDHEMRLS